MGHSVAKELRLFSEELAHGSWRLPCGDESGGSLLKKSYPDGVAVIEAINVLIALRAVEESKSYRRELDRVISEAQGMYRTVWGKK